MKINAVIFDVDGLMIDSERIARSTWKMILKDFNLTLDDEMYLELIGRSVEDTENYFKRVFGNDFPFQEILAKRQKFIIEEYYQKGLPLKPGIIELLDYLDDNKIPKAVGTSAPRKNAIVKLRITGLLPRFSTIVCGDDVPRGKPAPDIFLEAARQMGVPPNKCVVLEDAEAGILAAHAAGMLPVMIPDLKQPSQHIIASSYRILPSLHDALPLMTKILTPQKFGAI